MALTPQTSDAFLREVEDDVRRDRAISFARQWGVAIAVGVVVALAALAFWLWWQSREEARAEDAAVALSGLSQDLARDNRIHAPAVLARMIAAPGRGYPAAATMLKADLAATDGNIGAGAAGFRQIAGDTHLPQPLRDAATIRLATIEFDSAPPAATIARLHPLAAPGSPWFGSAGELTALAYLRLGKPAQAGSLLAAVAQDRGVPTSIRARAVQLASSLGVDAGDLGGAPR